MDLVLSLLASGGKQGARPFTSIPYSGTGALIARAVGVDATPGAAAFVGHRPSNGLQAMYDTVRGASARGRFSGEDAAAAFAFSGKNRIFTGTLYNVSSTPYVLWNFARLAGFFDIVTWNGGAASVAHALGEAPIAILTFRRTGTGGFTRPNNLYIPGDTGQIDASGASSEEPSVLRAFTGVDGSAMVPDNTAPNPVFPSGITCCSYLFGGGVGRVVVGEYTGDGSSTQDVTLAWPAGWVLVWRKPTSAFSNHCVGVYDPLVGQSMPFMGQAAQVPVFTVAGTTLAAGARANENGVVYRYLAVR